MSDTPPSSTNWFSSTWNTILDALSGYPLTATAPSMDEDAYIWSPWRASYGGLRSDRFTMFKLQDGTRECQGIVTCILEVDEPAETLLGAISVYMVRNHSFHPSEEQQDEPSLKLHFGVLDGRAVCASYVARSYRYVRCAVTWPNHPSMIWEYVAGIMSDHSRRFMLDQRFLQCHRIATNSDGSLAILIEDAIERTRQKGREQLGGI